MKKLKAQLELTRVLLAELSCEPCRFSILEKRGLCENPRQGKKVWITAMQLM
jgi:hypothetical protein